MSCLGIDIGTTSIKCCYYEKQTKSVCYSQQVHNANVCEVTSSRNEQSISDIFDAIRQAIRDLANQLGCCRLNVEQVSLCCQMHGIVLWNDCGQRSNLITWQDQRCDNDFISNLKILTPKKDLHAGYGNATLAWLTKYNPEFLQKYTYCGSIADIFTSVLCGINHTCTISDQNAQSWGFFDAQVCTWNNEALKLAGIYFKLPQIVKSGNVIGKVTDESFFIEKGAKVYVPIGDLQASVYSVLGNKLGQVFNYGTASQLVKTVAKLEDQQKLLQPSIRSALYTDKYDLATAASLNGGNAVDVVHKLLKSLSTTKSNDFDYESMMELAYKYKDTTLKANPLFFGERHDTNTYGSFIDITPENFSVGDISAAVFRGIVDNLFSMMPSFGNEDIPFFAVGISERKILQYYIKQKFGDFILFDKDITAAYGAIMYDLDNKS